jgi:tripartite-type tricarboxylate transporter receptor subunit TctC
MTNRVGVFFIGLIALAAFVPASGLRSAPYYEGKTITMIVGSEPGGSSDRMARLLAAYLPEHIPGKPVVIVQNMATAGSIAAANYVYNAVKPNGLSILNFQKSLVFSQLLKEQGVKFDLTKFCWIGSTSIESTVFSIRSDLPYKTIQDLQKAKQTFFVAGQGAATPGTQWTWMLIDYLGLNGKVVDYPGTAASVLALERKEADAAVFSFDSARLLVERGLIRPLVRTRISRGAENLPNCEDLTDNKTGKLVMAVHGSMGEASKPWAASPGTPDALMNILRDGFKKALRSPELQADAKKRTMDLEYVAAEDCLKAVNFVLTQPADVVKEFRKYVKLE